MTGIDWLVQCEACGTVYTPKSRARPDECYACGSSDVDATPVHEVEA